ncbi:hypothetical protein ACM0P6_08945 [Komagataeibacter sucrofermentans]|uniref:Uncharacterized protein n=1 Tax=Komagataeibacter sucrofermentans TaxID=1053551 RepID=A0A318QM28_9PROT|nr:hypothetical protein [Komagataeibacter sucrofermentans]PYD80095.1 hypothetical protein CFR77_03720 [Komagataeibacter sucrofermentans]GBQ48616.1 hypothetical protein AA15973_1529 [Komagataeibacter sucrofermentans DSM 15973]
MNQSSFNFGNAIGAWAGSHMVVTQWSYAGLPVLSACFALVGLGLVGLATHFQHRNASKAVPAAVVTHPASARP